jgi:pimeloyl-ACP methyl ester carboxylesterase
LAKKYRVIAPDLRGYGETDKPATGYDKRNMARDLRELMRALEIPKIALVGHDRGARVATRFAKDHPEALDRLVVMDNVPTRIVARDFNPIMARAYWFFIFNQIPDLPEALITGREDLWLGHLFADWSYNPHTISGEAFDTYVRAYRRPGAVRGALADYRANAEDVAQDKVDAEKKIACPTLSLWGADFYAVGQMFDIPSVWAEMAENLQPSQYRSVGTFLRKSNLRWSPSYSWTSLMVGLVDHGSSRIVSEIVRNRASAPHRAFYHPYASSTPR